MSHLQNYNITFTVIACDEDDAMAALGRKISDAMWTGKIMGKLDFKIVEQGCACDGEIGDDNKFRHYCACNAEISPEMCGQYSGCCGDCI